MLRHTIKRYDAAYKCRCGQKGDLRWAVRHAVESQYVVRHEPYV